MNARTHERTNARTNERTHARMNERPTARTHERTNEHMNYKSKNQLDKQVIPFVDDLFDTLYSFIATNFVDVGYN